MPKLLSLIFLCSQFTNTNSNRVTANTGNINAR